jgi:hypothetical protein
MLTTPLIVLGIAVWLWAGFKTWSFVLVDLIEERNRSGVTLAFLGGLFWPLTYLLLTVSLIGNVFRGQSLERSWGNIKHSWKK